MLINTFSSREFNQYVNKAKKAALLGPVFITDRGQAAHVLLTMEYYQKITDSKVNIVDLLTMPKNADFEFEPPILKGKLYKPADFS